MITDSTGMALLGLFMALWLFAATVLIWLGLSARRKAQKTLRQTARLTRLLETAPSVPAVVRTDGKIEASDRLARMLGVDGTIGSVEDLSDPKGNGMLPEELDVLQEYIRGAQRNASRFSMPVALQNSGRRFLVTGNIADAQIYPNGAALLWFFDLTENIQEWENSRNEATEAREAFTALSGLIEESPIPMWHRDKDLKLTLVNKAYVQAVNGKSADIVVNEGTELIEAADGKSAIDIAREAMNSGLTQERVISNTLDGERRQIKVIDIPLPDTGVAGIAVDVQDLEDARRQYRKLASAQHDLLDMMSSGVAQFDEDGILSFANSPFQRMFALRDQWIDEQPEFARLLDRMRENGKLPEVRDFPEWRAEKESWFRSTKGNEENWLLADGTHLRVLAQPLPTGGLLTIFEDRTEQAQLASARDTLLRVRTATFDNLSEAIAVFSGDGKLSIWNSRFAQNWNLTEEFLGKHPRQDELLPQLAKQLKKPAEISMIGELLRSAADNRTQKEVRIIFGNGHMFQVGTVPLPDGNVLFTMLDMTDSIQVENALRERNVALSEADGMKNKFLANMSYEFRTPLTSISGFADLLKQGIGGELPESALEYVDAISVSAARLSDQINTVLDYSQTEAGAMPLTAQEIKLPEFIDNLIAAHAEDAVSRGVDLRKEVSDDIGTVNGDEVRLSQALKHILSNAIQYGRDDGEVLVAAQVAQNMVQIIISDNGPGLSEGQIAELTQQGDRDNQAAGLGLPLAKQLIDAHGGNFDIQSELGVGTSVIITLPKA